MGRSVSAEYRLCVLLGVGLLASLALQSGLLAVVVYTLAGLWLVSRWLARAGLANVSVTRQCNSEPAEIGQTRTVTLRVRNRGSAPLVWVLMEELLPRFAVRRSHRLRLHGKPVKIASIRPDGEVVLKYQIEFLQRGYYQIGPLALETGDLFGLHRRHRVAGKPAFILVYPKVVLLTGYDIASERPIGEVRLAHLLFEDPTRNAGIRPYQPGDPLQRVHWRATGRTGVLQSKLYDPTTLSGASILLDLHSDGYPARGEPIRSELAITVAASLAYALATINQQVGLASNGRDAADRLRLAATHISPDTNTDTDTDASDRLARLRETVDRSSARAGQQMADESVGRLQPVLVETRRGLAQFQRIRETLARLELSEGLPFTRLVVEVTPRLPRDATILAILPAVPPESAFVLGNLRKQGFAVTVVLVMFDEEEQLKAHGRLLAAGVRDVRHLPNEAAIANLGTAVNPLTGPYSIAADLT